MGKKRKVERMWVSARRSFPKYKKINGKRFRLVNLYVGKKFVKNEAHWFRLQGWYARVIPVKGGYLLYKRPTKHRPKSVRRKFERRR